MPHHLMNLRHVPDDEADEIRALFDQHGVRYYETPPSRWGISMGGFWVHDDDEAARARPLLEAYQRQRRDRQREDFRARQARGEVGFRHSFRQKPVTILAACFAIVVILVLVLAPFIRLG
ncbi:MAG: DUF6164 family protein [Pseudomonadota bacterium]|nr:DUF6164 family protein [Pseudomonadota bacterium]